VIEKIRIGTRGSALALWQTEYVRDLLLKAQPQLQVEIQIFRTSGDLISETPLHRIGRTGLFTRELEDALLDKRIDISVNSLKDMSSRLPEGLVYTASPEREDPRDAFISTKYNSLDELPTQARMATGSVRRQAQLNLYRPGIRFSDLRGNIDTRLRKMQEQDLDGIIMAAAALNRLGLKDRIQQFLDPIHFVPSAGQGAIAIECREEDRELRDLLQTVNHRPTYTCCLAERAFMSTLNGGCSVSLGALALLRGDELELRAFVSDPQGSVSLNESLIGGSRNPELLGQQLAEEFLARGAADILGSPV